MRIVDNVPQGSQAWHEFRASRLTASEAPAMLGVSKYMSRDELLAQKVTGATKEVSTAQQALFDRGHAAEATARPIAEEIIKEELYPVTAEDDAGMLSASMDGLTILGDAGWECKLWSKGLAAQVRAENLEEHYRVQMDQQMLVTGAERILFMCTDGTAERCVHMWYERDESRFARIIAGWEQFRADMAAYSPTEKAAKGVGVRPDSLPALFVDVAGSLTTTSNLAEFRSGAEMLIGSIKTDLQTDQDFLDAEEAVKWLSDAEKRIEVAKQNALAKTASLEELFRTLDDVRENLMRTTRLKLERQVKTQKESRRNQIVADAEATFGNFLDATNNEFKAAKVSIGAVRPDFNLAIKGKRSFDSMASACNDLIAQSKIEVNEIASKVRSNLALLAQHNDHDFLFQNKQQLAFMDADHLALTIKAKIDEYKEQQAATEAERVRKHKNAIAGIEAAGEFGEDVPLLALEQTRDRIADLDTSRLEEFAIQADQAKAATLAKLAEQIKYLHRCKQLEDEEHAIRAEAAADAQRQAQASPPKLELAQEALVVDDQQTSGTAFGSADPLEGGQDKGRAETLYDRPTDQQIVEALALHFRVHESVVLQWLLEFDHEEAGNDLAASF